MFFGKERKKKKEFEKIYKENVDKIFRFTYLKVNSKDEAEDITSVVFTRFWKKIEKQEKHDDKNIKNPKAFLYTIARNLIIDHYRERKEDKDVDIEKVTIEDEKINIEEDVSIKQEIEQVKEALDNVNKDYQDIIIWYYINELTIPEIAELLNKPEANIRVLIHRGMESLKKQLKTKRKTTEN
ncbi:MAG: sigma-70 family RNA polymerase sigma factor [Patescibacteria group bacterium]|jgi:RNA polymerase sigma-70 factor (ECF subfamily)|nr:sigma-70 family RNA polymerase sigma factor [Patescibacteria group bacterium]